MSPAENLIFYGTESLSTGWELISSKVGEDRLLWFIPKMEGLQPST